MRLANPSLFLQLEKRGPFLLFFFLKLKLEGDGGDGGGVGLKRGLRPKRSSLGMLDRTWMWFWCRCTILVLGKDAHCKYYQIVEVGADVHVCCAPAFAPGGRRAKISPAPVGMDEVLRLGKSDAKWRGFNVHPHYGSRSLQ